MKTDPLQDWCSLRDAIVNVDADARIAIGKEIEIPPGTLLIAGVLSQLVCVLATIGDALTQPLEKENE